MSPLVRKDDDPRNTLEELLQQSRIEELTSEHDGYEDVEPAHSSTAHDFNGHPFPGNHLQPARTQAKPPLPPWLQAATLGLFHEDLTTTTTQAQAKVTKECLPHLTGQDTSGFELNSHGLPHLRRTQHAAFLHAQFEPLPAPYVAIDASRPWFFYWVLSGLSALGEDINPYREPLIATVRPLQNPTGGFGGGHGQLSHCACSYATILALTIADALHVVDRRATWHWLGTLKQPDGGFRMAIGAEEDIRGAYCAMTMLTLLNLPLELPPDSLARTAGLTRFTDKLGEWISHCQTYEGGIAGAPTNEAHGAIPRYLDVPALLAWLAARQTQPEGGFQGRQEKLVDACYSHWVGGCWALITAALQQPPRNSAALWNRAALVRYLLTCCQQPGKKKGGMRDKPSTRPDAYHTLYSLAGLSHAQNVFTYNARAPTTGEGRSLAAFNWAARGPSKEEMRELGVDEEDLVNFVHPVFVIPMAAVERARQEFEDGTL
ncbi:terpenoid cyclases/protein prenyltransferase alpha-alpha toroid [Neohortaea acidophila]|uniref:Terpenoid cyclases/protein prenyltransferase alpha-alpha toroid n=1 Tax=Neohortaea acidophila TaxID=245834 RepID=A0A6A6PGS9_9PEZI|nr:terpenoid cyclases/protein prenyltransferase alpha-alpha toroid [Neohortaea acidophila]KAF2479192.1 terpenoid cyclases/protein prenyltransferase alpha-alpha toroid [Neohortaea acidophila]